jgi:hypothetical protein
VIIGMLKRRKAVRLARPSGDLGADHGYYGLNVE